MISLLLQAEPGTWIDYVERGGLLGGSFLLIWALITERLVPGQAHLRAVAEERARSEEWRRLFQESALPLAEQAVQVAKRRG